MVFRYRMHHDYLMYGRRFARNERTSGLSNKFHNEVYEVIHQTAKQSRFDAHDVLVRASCSQIVRKKRLRLMRAFTRGDQESVGLLDDDELLCRWQYRFITKVFPIRRPLSGFSVPASKISGASFEPLPRADHEDDPGKYFNVVSKKQPGLTQKAFKPANNKGQKDDCLSSAFETLSIGSSSENIPVRRYTFADVCCGAGGASHGANMAGLEVIYALDHDSACCDTYRRNFPQTRLYQEELHKFAVRNSGDLTVDIVHCSPPCQAFSWANTKPNLKKDTLNIATNMALGGFLDIAKPRVVTVEQTSALMSHGDKDGRHSDSFGKFIEQLTSRSYSVAWKIENLVEFGLPQKRKRLIMIATRLVSSPL
ncbi:MAG: hypothetical protein Q9174_002468 [Haloplaca sp. 1 TL-2023]